MPEWDIFICHASPDKENFVRPLAERIRRFGVRAWYDEFELRPGDILRRKINEGLAKSRFGLVVLSPAFFGRPWAEYELDGITAIAIGKDRFILPIWLNVSRNEVLQVIPPLADTVAYVASNYNSIFLLARDIVKQIRPDLVEGADQAQQGEIILWEPSASLSYVDLKHRYSRESGWVEPELEVPHILETRDHCGVPLVFTRNQVKCFTDDQDYVWPTDRLPRNLRDPILRCYRFYYPKKRLYDDPKCRLVKYQVGGAPASLRLWFGRATYFDNLITHQLVDFQLQLPTPSKPVAIRDVLENNDGVLCSITASSRFANTIGRGGLVFTADGYLLLSQRSGEVVVDAGKEDLPVQGSGDLKGETQRYDLFADFKQEAEDELLLRNSEWARLQDGQEAILLLGLTRNAERAGKPEFVFLCKTIRNRSDVVLKAENAQHAWERRGLSALPPDTQLRELKEMCRFHGRMAPDCRVAIALLLQCARIAGLDDTETLRRTSDRLLI